VQDSVGAFLVQRLTVQYFANLREERGVSDETRETQARTPVQLYEEIANEYHLTVALSALRVAVNDEFSTMDAVLKDGDVVAFIPPVAGG